MDELPLPEPGKGEVRIRVAACGVSFVDLLMARGKYQLRPPLPFVAGSEFAGFVDAVGDEVDANWKVGAAASGARATGAWAQYVCVPANILQHVAPELALDEASIVNAAYGTALYALRERASLQHRETVLVLGAGGGVGQAAVQIARLLGAGLVIAAASSPGKRDAAREAGADHVVDAGDPEWKDRVKALAGKGGVDVVFDPVGGEATDIAFRTLGWGGRHLMVGFAGGQIGALRSNLAVVKGASLIGVDLRQFRERQPAAAQALMNEVCKLHRDGRIRPCVAAVLPLGRFAEAIELVQDRATVGRVLLRP